MFDNFKVLFPPTKYFYIPVHLFQPKTTVYLQKYGSLIGVYSEKLQIRTMDMTEEQLYWIALDSGGLLLSDCKCINLRKN